MLAKSVPFNNTLLPIFHLANFSEIQSGTFISNVHNNKSSNIYIIIISPISFLRLHCAINHTFTFSDLYKQVTWLHCLLNLFCI